MSTSQWSKHYTQVVETSTTYILDKKFVHVCTLILLNKFRILLQSL